jgi:hypothetical protein
MGELTQEWVFSALIFLVLGAGSVGAGRASGWHAHKRGDPHGDMWGYALGLCLWLGSVASAAYLGAALMQGNG